MMQSQSSHGVPKAPLRTAIALVASALVVVGLARIGGVSPEQSLGASEILQSRLLRFEDAADGSVRILDGETGKPIATAAPGTNGFLRGTLRGLMRVRKKAEVSYFVPYRLEQLSNGQLMLTDLGENITLDLNAYGQTNAAVFSAFLTPSGGNS
jgi:putative photosynthetic complex assembly protein